MTIVDDTTTAPAPSPSGTPSASTSAPPAARRRPGLNTETLALGGLFIAMFAFLTAIFAVGLAARAATDAKSAPAAASAAGPPTVELMDFMIMPNPIAAPAGTTTLTVENTGATDHTLAIEDGAETPAIAPGESGQLDISGLAAGTYTVICTIAGHREAGMEGTLTIG